MIKAAIAGARTPRAGELIRILVNHPDVEIVSLVAPGYEGQLVQSIHHGLLGEEKMTISSLLPSEGIDVLFLAGDNHSYEDVERIRNAHPEIKIISLSPLKGMPEECDYIYALPEINRKSLVREASAARIPHPFASLVLVPLYPLALHMLLNSDLEITLSVPKDMIQEKEQSEAIKEITDMLKEAQKSFSGKVSFIPAPPSSKRGMEINLELDCPLDLESVMTLYEMYDDHNFAFAVTTPVKLDDVKGTEKCITSVTLDKEGKLHLHSVADGRLRGSAGEAVHVMNLMFGLHEKTGLYLKPYAY